MAFLWLGGWNFAWSMLLFVLGLYIPLGLWIYFMFRIGYHFS